MFRWVVAFRVLSRRIAVRTGIFAVFGGLTVLGAFFLGPLVPEPLQDRFGSASALSSLLTILATSLLAVATFSLGTAVTAYTALASAATPRVSGLVTSHPQTQTSLATFTGGFLYAIIGLVVLGPEMLGRGGRAFLFLATIVMMLAVAWTLVRWIGLLSQIARVTHAIESVAKIGENEFQALAEQPHRGALARRPADLDGTGHQHLRASRTGYWPHPDFQTLQSIAVACECFIEIEVTPGTLVMQDQPLLTVWGARCDEATEQIRSQLDGQNAISGSRTFDDDPRFALTVLSEIAAKAMSPGINDPGTAIDVVHTCTRLLQGWAGDFDPDPTVSYDRISVPGLAATDLIDDGFTQIAHYGAGDVAVGIHLQKCLSSLATSAHHDLAAASREFSRLALELSDQALPTEHDRDRVGRASQHCDG